MYTILLYNQFLNTENKEQFIQDNYDNQEFMKLLYTHQFIYPKLSFPNLSLTKLQKNTINKFYNLALQYRFKNVNWKDFFNECDIHSYNLYKQILTTPLKLNCKLLPFLKIINFRYTNNFTEGDIIEEHNKGKKIAVVKYKDDVFYTQGTKYYFSEWVSRVVNDVFKAYDNITIYGFRNKTKISLYDINLEMTQIDRIKLLITKFYQNEKMMKSVFELPSHQRTNFDFSEGKIYLLKTESKGKIINRILNRY